MRRAILTAVGAMALAAPASASAAVDFDIVMVERNQVVQNIDNAIPMVLGKAMGVRVHVKATGDRSTASDGGYTVGGATLDVYRGTTYLGTLQPVGHTAIRVVPTTASALQVATASRQVITRSFNFRVPESLQFADGIRIVASINNTRSPAETSYANNTESRTISFVRTRDLVIHGVQFSSPQHGCSEAVWDDTLVHAGRLLRFWPIDRVVVSGRGSCLPYTRLINPNAIDDDYFPGSQTVIADANAARMASSTYSGRTWYVLAPWDICPCGFGYFGGPSAAIGTDAGGPDADLAGRPANTAYLGVTMAHELAHTEHSRRHVGTDGHPADATTPDTTCCFHGSINGVYESTIGLDPMTMTLYTPRGHAPGAPHDFMSYGPAPVWPSDYTYLAILRAREITAGGARVKARSSQAQGSRDYLIISGTAAPAPRIDHGYVVDLPAGSSDAPGAGPYSLDLLDADGNVLFTRNFENRAADGAEVPFSEAVPFDSRVRSVRLRQGDAILATRGRSANAPSVTITTPKPGVHWSGPRQITWEASDADGDELRYMVQYSSDGGRNWLTVGSNLTEAKLDIDAGTLQGSRDCRIRVIATDGLNSSTAVSEPFGVDPHEPVAEIESARADRSGAVALSGSGFDADDAELAPEQLVWSSSRAGRLGQGETLVSAPLKPGRHAITLRVTDRDGNKATARTTVRVPKRPVPAAPRRVRARRAGAGVRVTWRGSRPPFVVQRARRGVFRTVARVGRRSFTGKRGSYRVAACSRRGCSDFVRAR